MSKFYAQWRRPKQTPRPWRVHPIWRGIGCFLILLLPILAYGISDLLIQANLTERWVIIPYDLTGPSQYPYLFAKLGLAAVIAFGLFGLFTVFYTFVYRVAGPPRYGPMDVPPVKRKPVSKKTRR